jgi:hypothetical protein
MKRRSFIQLGAIGALIPAYRGLSTMIPGRSGIIEMKREIPVSGEYDIVVCGAGPAGISAAIEAGRNGAKTLLVETHGCLGGIWTAGLLTWILDHIHQPGLLREIEYKLIAGGAVSQDIDTGGPLSFDPEIMKFLLEELCLEAGVDILLHTRVVASIKDENNMLTHIITESKSGREAFRGNVFIDSTGDGDLAASSGCGYDLGREGDGALQPFSLLALVTGINFDEIREYSRWTGIPGGKSKINLLAEINRGGAYPSYMNPSLHPIRKDLFKFMANHEYGYSPLNSRDVTKATLNARKEVNNIVKALRSNGGVWKNLRIVATGEQIGTREGRRIHGLYTVTVEDMIKGSRFDDSVCRVGGGVNVHSVSMDDMEAGKTGGDYSPGIKTQEYDIPIRSLIAKDVGGLLMAGRCISGDFLAHSKYRNTGYAVPMGQAAGRVAAISSRMNILPQEVNFQSLGI